MKVQYSLKVNGNIRWCEVQSVEIYQDKTMIGLHLTGNIHFDKFEIKSFSYLDIDNVRILENGKLK